MPWLVIDGTGTALAGFRTEEKAIAYRDFAVWGPDPEALKAHPAFRADRLYTYEVVPIADPLMEGCYRALEVPGGGIELAFIVDARPGQQIGDAPGGSFRREGLGRTPDEAVANLKALLDAPAPTVKQKGAAVKKTR